MPRNIFAPSRDATGGWSAQLKLTKLAYNLAYMHN